MSEPGSYQVLDREYLEARARILELGAIFDRIDRSPTARPQDPRLAKLREAIRCVLAESPAGQPGSTASRAEQVQLVFSRDYEENWRERFGV